MADEKSTAKETTTEKEVTTESTGATAEPPNQSQAQPDQTKGEGGQEVGEPMPAHQGSVHSEDAIEQDAKE
ncbi:MAG: hypothetical protein M3072_17380 [Candidatus Dormibacteraeota bacterium]|nr:hypothetical protein [Candidatus Dormibacteraeota bacterium]